MNETYSTTRRTPAGAQGRSSAPVRRRRPPKKPDYTPILVVAAGIFLVGFLLGFLIRGLFVPKPQEDPGSTQPVSQTEPVETQATEPSEESTAESTEPTGYGTAVSPGDWQLTLVNAANPLAMEDPDIELADIPNGQKLDSRALADFEAMLDAMTAAGLNPVIRSGYRSMADQQQVWESKLKDLEAQGMTSEEAKAEAMNYVALPGTSEHQLGLALDIVDDSYWKLDEKQESTPVQKWLVENCWDYGFVLRYPADKTEITGVAYEPWHYRYVGREAAREMKEQGMCLEEYVVYLEQKA